MYNASSYQKHWKYRRGEPMGRRCQDGGRDGGYHIRASWREDASTGDRQYLPATEERWGGPRPMAMWAMVREAKKT